MGHAVRADASGPYLDFYPLNAIFSFWKKLLAKVFRLSSDNKMSQEELLMLVDEVQQDGALIKTRASCSRTQSIFPSSARRIF